MSIRQDLEAEEKMVRETPKYRLEDLLDDAIDSLKNTINREDYDSELEYIEDTISEIADGYVPIYTYDLFRYGAENYGTLNDKPEWECDDDMVKILQANIYCYLIEGLSEAYEEIKEEESNE